MSFRKYCTVLKSSIKTNQFQRIVSNLSDDTVKQIRAFIDLPFNPVLHENRKGSKYVVQFRI